MEELAKLADDVNELPLEIGAKTPDVAEDVLARRFHANAIIGLLNRTLALDGWNLMQNP
jgi:F-box protein 21